MNTYLVKVLLNPGCKNEFTTTQMIFTCDSPHLDRVQFLAEKTAKEFLRDEWTLSLPKTYTGSWFQYDTDSYCVGIEDGVVYSQVTLEKIRHVEV